MTLLRLTIENVGLIARAEVDFGAGLTVVTGETGSGKTMLLDALGLALGARADAATVRTGSDGARVTLQIEPDAAVRGALERDGFALAADDELIVVRELAATGRSQGRINGSPASASQLRTLVGPLIDVVSQHEAQRLLAPGFALDLVDRFAGEPALQLRARVHDAVATLRAATQRVAELRDLDGRALAQAEFARFAVAEIDAARLSDVLEDERLRERREVLANAERIVTALEDASRSLSDESGAVDRLGDVHAGLAPIVRYGEELAALGRTAGALQAEVSELATRIAREREAIDLDPAELETVNARLDALDRLKRKYGGTLAEVQAARERFAAELLDVDDRDARLAEAERERGAIAADVAACAEALRALRVTAADAIAAAVAGELAALAMPAARLTVALEPLDEIGPTGGERAELRFAPNPGEAERPLAKVASGGELSRVLLAVVLVLADRRDPTVLVFDEIDAGVGGTTAIAVGERLARLAQTAQVVCVTHLAQIAAYGATHVALRKTVAGGSTAIDAVTLAAADRTTEIARMLAGDARGVALDHAAELLAAHATIR